MIVQIPITVPDDTRWRTTGKNGLVAFWRGIDPPECDYNGDWWGRVSSHTTIALVIYTNQECPDHRESLIDLREEVQHV